MSKNPTEYGYRGDEQITISAREFLLLRKAIEDGVNNATIQTMPEVIKYVTPEGDDFEGTPTEEDFIKDTVRAITDIRKTVSESNLKISFDPNKLTKEMLLANELLLEIHLRNVENNVATHRDDIKTN